MAGILIHNSVGDFFIFDSIVASDQPHCLINRSAASPATAVTGTVTVSVTVPVTVIVIDTVAGTAVAVTAVAVVVTALRVARRCRRIGYLMCHHSPYITALLLCLNLLSHLTSRCRELGKKRRRRWCRKWNRKRERSRSKKWTRDGKRL